MVNLRFSLHKAQQVILNSLARFKIVAAGRRFGKTYLACVLCIVEGLRTDNSQGVKLSDDSEVVYIGVTLEQAKRNAWNLMKSLARPVTAKVHENTAVITLVNGVRVRFLGMDSPDAARGMKLRFAVLDEYADMPDYAWKEIIRPALMDTKGGALFIGTPKGKNHFYALFLDALRGKAGWEAFNFTSSDNPLLDSEELGSIEEDLSSELVEQEIAAKFISRGGKLFNADDFRIVKQEPIEGSWCITVDPPGFGTEQGKTKSEIRQLDECAIAVTKVVPVVDRRGRPQTAWWIKDIQHGRWGARETSNRIVRAAVEHQVMNVGIEKGSLLNAMQDYLTEYVREYNKPINFHPLSTGGKNKVERVQWALQGRAEKGRVMLNPGPWNDPFIEQAVDFPSRLTHDDLVDAVAYVDQMVPLITVYIDVEDFPGEYEPLDAISGY